MADITMCLNKECSKKDNCYRFLAKASIYMQSYADFKEDENGMCEHYIKYQGE